MTAAIVGTLLHPGLGYTWIVVAMIVGTMIGVPLSKGAADRGAAANRLARLGGLAAALVGTRSISSACPAAGTSRRRPAHSRPK